MNQICSDNFQYQNVDYTIYTDGALIQNNGHVGWVIKTKTERDFLEGRTIINYKKTSVLEISAIVIALQELNNKNCDVLIQTDFKGVITEFNNENKINIKLKKELHKFNSWCIEKTKRDNIHRPHNLCSSLNQNHYIPNINFS